MKKYLKGFLIGLVLAGVLTAGISYAQIGSINYFKKVGNDIQLLKDTWTLYAHNASFDNVEIGGVSAGNLDMNGNKIYNGYAELTPNVDVTSDTNDGSTKPLTLNDSDDVEIFAVDSLGNVTGNGFSFGGATTTISGLTVEELDNTASSTARISLRPSESSRYTQFGDPSISPPAYGNINDDDDVFIPGDVVLGNASTDVVYMNGIVNIENKLQFDQGTAGGWFNVEDDGIHMYTTAASANWQNNNYILTTVDAVDTKLGFSSASLDPTFIYTADNANVNTYSDGTYGFLAMSSSTDNFVFGGGATTSIHLVVGADPATYDGTEEGLFIDTSGNIGMGTNSPSTSLHIYNSLVNSMRVESASTGAYYDVYGLETSDATPFGGFRGFNNKVETASIYINRDGANDAGRLRFMTQATGGSLTEQMSIMSDGKVGIGTDTPDSKFEISDSATGVSQILSSYSDTITHRSNLSFYKSHSDTLGSNVATIDNDILGSSIFWGNSGSNFTQGASIIAIQDGVAGTFTPTELQFLTSDGTATPENRMVIDKDGKVGIGTTTPRSRLDLGYFYFPDTDGTAGQVLQTNGSDVLSWADASGGVTGYDITIDSAGGGDYTDISTGFAAASSGDNILVMGSFTETSNLTVPAGVNLTFKDATLTLNGAYMGLFVDDTKADGSLTLVGTGADVSDFLRYFWITGDWNDWSGLQLELNPTTTSTPANGSLLIHESSDGSHNQFNIISRDKADWDSAGAVIYFSTQGTYSHHKLMFSTITNGGGGDTIGAQIEYGGTGVFIEINADHMVENGGGGSGIGFKYGTSAVDATVIGTSKDNDSNLTGSGTNCNSAALNSV